MVVFPANVGRAGGHQADRARRRRVRRGRESVLRRGRDAHGEDVRLRGRVLGETAGLIVQGAKEAQAEGCRLNQIEVVLNQIESASGDLVRS